MEKWARIFSSLSSRWLYHTSAHIAHYRKVWWDFSQPVTILILQLQMRAFYPTFHPYFSPQTGTSSLFCVCTYQKPKGYFLNRKMLRLVYHQSIQYIWILYVSLKTSASCLDVLLFDHADHILWNLARTSNTSVLCSIIIITAITCTKTRDHIWAHLILTLSVTFPSHKQHHVKVWNYFSGHLKSPKNHNHYCGRVCRYVCVVTKGEHMVCKDKNINISIAKGVKIPLYSLYYDLKYLRNFSGVPSPNSAEWNA